MATTILKKMTQLQPENFVPRSNGGIVQLVDLTQWHDSKYFYNAPLCSFELSKYGEDYHN